MTKERTGPGSPAAGFAAKQPDLAMATTLAARLCHDLAGTMGALTGMLDLAVEGDDPDALALALTCARELSGKLRLLRAAWSDEGEIPELSSVLAGLPGADRLTVELPKGPAMGDAARHLAANLLLLAASGLPRGGRIEVDGGDAGLSVEIAGPRAAWPVALERCLADPAFLRDACTRSREVGVAVACLLAAHAGWRLTLHGPTRLTAGP